MAAGAAQLGHRSPSATKARQHKPAQEKQGLEGNLRAMKRALLDYLACPDCGGDIEGDFQLELENGELSCADCRRRFPVAQGVPTLLPSQSNALALQVADEFAEQWKRYDDRRAEYRQQLLDWLAPVRPEFFAGKVVLDGGCGKGRHLQVTSTFEAKMVIGVDLGEAVYVARQSTRELDNVEIVRGDMLCLPFKSGVFDYAYSVGVLHHLPDPRGGFDSMLSKVAVAGHVSAWVYGYENNEWIVKLVNPFRDHVSNRMPRSLLKGLSWLLAGAVVLAARGVYKPWHQRFPSRRLFYQDYLLYIADFPHREIETIVYDQLNPKIAFYLPREEFASWFTGLEDVGIAWHNRNSWRGFARKPG
jgi:SAM-dependent methyltransferase